MPHFKSSLVRSVSLVAMACLGAACSNRLPGLGHCAAASAGISPPAGQVVDLLGSAASFDDLRYSPALKRVLATPLGSGIVFVVDPDSSAVTKFTGVPSGVSSVDA